MRPFYLNGMLRALVFALVGIFTPIFVYKLGGLWWVLGYYGLTRLVTLVTVIPIAKVIEGVGFRRSIAVSLLFLAVNLGSLLLSGQYHWLVWISAIAGGINIPFYWVARNSAISQDEDKKAVGRQMGVMTTVESIATMLGPLTAGLVIERWGFVALYSLALLVLMVSVVPLWGMPPHVHKNGATWRGFGKWLANRRYFHNGVGIGARAVDNYSLSILWPLTIFVLGIKTGVLGGIFTLVSILALVGRVVMGRVFDKLHAKGDMSDEWVYGVSAIVSSMIWLGRIFVRSLGAIVGLDLVGALFGTAYASLYIDYEQLGGKRMGSMAYWVYGEIMYSIMAIGLFGITGIGAYFGIWRETFMILASFWVLVSIVMARESNMR